MKKMNGKRMLLLMMALCIALLPALALADVGADSAGNELIAGESAAGVTVGGDLYSIGQNVDASNAKIAESALLAGQMINVNNATIGGSLRAAGYQISAANTAVDVNATLAAYSINMGTGFAAKAVYAAASDVSFAGSCETMGISANTVTISGTVNGDAFINASTVNVLDTAVIKGNLNVTGAAAPTVAAGASVGNVNFTLEQNTSDTEVAEATVTVSAAAKLLAKLSKLVMMLPGRIILAVVYYLIIRKTVDGAAEMVKTRPAAMPVSGFITLISLPIAAIILLCTVVGVPAGMLLLCLYGLALAFAVSFAGAMAGKLVFPKMHTLLAYIIGVSAMTLLKLVPYLGGVLTFAAMIYTLGYFIQKIYLGFSKKDEAPAETPAAPVPAAPAETTEAL